MNGVGRANRAGAAALLLLTVLALHLLALQAVPREHEAPASRPFAVVVRNVAAPGAPGDVAERAGAPEAATAMPPARATAAPAAAPRAKRAERTPVRNPAAVPAPAAAPTVEAQAPPPTRPPPPATLRFTLLRGAQSGLAELHWQHDGQRYEARFAAAFDGGARWQWLSRGGFDAAGVAPERFVSQGRRTAAAVNFQRDAGKITFSGPTLEHPLEPGAQDRLTWMLQLAAIAQARAPRAGERIAMQVAGPRGDAEAWRFEVLGDDVLDTAAGPIQVLRLRREAQHRHDTRIEVWLDPARHHLPVRALLSNEDDGREKLELLLAR
jgi:hypothetical protein